MIRIKVTDSGVNSEMAKLLQRFDNPDAALKAIGERLVAFTVSRFDVSQDPYGVPWFLNSDTTLRRMLHGNPKNFVKSTGKVSALGLKRLAAKKPLIGESKALSTQFSWRLVGNGVELSSPMRYAATQQFGAKKSDFPHLWGDIPARPFFPDVKRGLPGALEDDIRQVLTEFLSLRNR